MFLLAPRPLGRADSAPPARSVAEISFSAESWGMSSLREEGG